MACEDVRVRDVLPGLHLDEEVFRGTDLHRGRAIAEPLARAGKEPVPVVVVLGAKRDRRVLVDGEARV